MGDRFALAPERAETTPSAVASAVLVMCMEGRDGRTLC